jgi:hyperosmotically inducible periplasmic protein
MRFRNWLGALALGAMAMAPSAALAQTAQTDDSTLDNRIEARIKASETLKHDSIDVKVENGVVTLTGKVASTAQRTQAGTLANIAGVSRVDNKLEIDTTIGDKLDKAVDKTEKAAGTAGTATKNAAGKTKDATVKAAEKTKDGAVYVGKKTKDGAEYVGEKTKDGAVKTKDEVTDGWLLTKLNADFVNEDTLKGSSINVDSDNQVVTLKGTVTSEAGRQRAVEIAKTTKGVKRVIDNLVIAPK